MEQGFSGQVLSSADVKKKLPVHALEMHYGNHPVYYTLVYVIKMVVGGIWITIWIALILTMIRYIRAYFKIGWTRSDEMQMQDYYGTKTVAQIFVFTILWTILSGVLTTIPFGRDVIYYGLLGGGIYLGYVILNYLKDKLLQKKAAKQAKTKTD